MSILIVNYNGRKHLAECLDSIFSQDFRDFEVVMVDNASSDGSVDFVRVRYPEVRLVLSETNLGFAGGNNLGYRNCRGEHIFFLNNDTLLEQGALAALAAAMEEHPGVRVFGAFLISHHDRSLVDSAGDTVYRGGGTFSFTGYPVSRFTETRPITSPCAGAAVYAREVLERIGLFDEDFFLNFEDLDLGFRARHAGERILFLPSVKVYHKGSATLGGKKSALSIYYSERNFGLFVLKNWPLRNLVEFIPSYLLVKFGRFVTSARLGLLGAYFRGNLDCLRLMPRMLPKRRRILSSSTLSADAFRALLRRNFIRERIAFKRGDRSSPL